MSTTKRLLIGIGAAIAVGVCAILWGEAHSATPMPTPPPAPQQQVTVTQVEGIGPPLTLGTLPWTGVGLNLRPIKPAGTVRIQSPSGGSFLQFSIANGVVSFDFENVSTCPPLPPPLTRVEACPAGTTGTWTQTATFSSAPYPTCSVQGPWLPATAPAGACVPIGPALGPPLPQSQLVAVAKPAKNVPFTTQYHTTETRVTDHHADHPACDPWMREDYSRRESVNSDASKLLVYCGSGGAWLVYNIPANTFGSVLTGPGGDAEIQWSPTDPNTFYYIDTNGGTVIRSHSVSANTNAIVYDFTTAVHALLGSTAARCWTKSEGSPSADNRYWGLMCETNSFAMLGYIVVDLQAHAIIWWKADTALPDHSSMTPSGRSIERSGDDAPGTYTTRISDGKTCQLHHKSEHSDIGVLPNGHDFYASIDFQTNAGDLFWIDIDQCYADGAATRNVWNHAYSNPLWGTNYSFHFSAKAFGMPGRISASNYGTPKTSLVIYDIATAATYGVAVIMDNDGNYWDEPQAFLSRDGHSAFFNDNFGTSLDIDVYRIDGL